MLDRVDWCGSDSTEEIKSPPLESFGRAGMDEGVRLGCGRCLGLDVWRSGCAVASLAISHYDCGSRGFIWGREGVGLHFLRPSEHLLAAYRFIQIESLFIFD